MPVKNRFAELLPEITAWRRDFHENPELQYEVHRTAGKVAELLRSFSVDAGTEGVGGEGGGLTDLDFGDVALDGVDDGQNGIEIHHGHNVIVGAQ